MARFPPPLLFFFFRVSKRKCCYYYGHTMAAERIFLLTLLSSAGLEFLNESWAAGHPTGIMLGLFSMRTKESFCISTNLLSTNDVLVKRPLLPISVQSEMSQLEPIWPLVYSNKHFFCFAIRWSVKTRKQKILAAWDSILSH